MAWALDQDESRGHTANTDGEPSNQGDNMSRTMRKVPFWASWKPYQQVECHRRKGNWHKGGPSKFHVGPGGINCPCCTRLPPGKLKVACRRAERRISKQFLMAE